MGVGDVVLEVNGEVCDAANILTLKSVIQQTSVRYITHNTVSYKSEFHIISDMFCRIQRMALKKVETEMDLQ